MNDRRQICIIENLNWLPWVGDQFNSLTMGKRMPNEGESYYHDNTTLSIGKHNIRKSNLEKDLYNNLN